MRDQKGHRLQATAWLIICRPLRFITRCFKATCNMQHATCDLQPATCKDFTPPRKEERGFTLMELIIVIAVIAILIGIAIPGFFGMLTEAHITQASGDLRTIKTAIESYFMHQSPAAYPTPGTTWESQLTTASPKILGDILLDPFGTTDNAEYTYTLSGNELYYVILSLGPDGEVDITGISGDGKLLGIKDDDVFVTNGTGFVE